MTQSERYLMKSQEISIDHHKIEYVRMRWRIEGQTRLKLCRDRKSTVIVRIEECLSVSYSHHIEDVDK